MSLSVDQIYELLPAIYRTRDVENGQPLYALLTVIAAQGAILEENIRQLYDDAFIETCAPWVIPYIGDLVGSDTVYELSGSASGRRAEVANTIGYRRRKGTLLALEQVAMDVSGLPVAAVESFERLIVNESLRNVRTHHAATLDLRRGQQLERMGPIWLGSARFGAAFDSTNRTVDVRRIEPRLRTPDAPDSSPLEINLHGGGKYNIPDIRLFLWRWKSFAVTQAPAFVVGAGRYRFSPIGLDIPLFNAQPPRESFSRLTTRMDVPQPIERREFAAHPAAFYGPNLSLQIFADGLPVPLSQLCVGDLSCNPDGSWGCTPKGKVAVDPVLGRIQWGPGQATPDRVTVNYHYGFPAELGGGPYDRSGSLPALQPSQFPFLAVVGEAATPTLEDAVAAWNSEAPGTQGLIVLPNFESLAIDLTGANAIQLAAQSRLYLVAAQTDPSLPLTQQTYAASNACVTLTGNVEVAAPPVSTSPNPPPAGQLILSGLWIAGTLLVQGGAASVQALDCTFVPGTPTSDCKPCFQPITASITGTAAEVSLGLTRCITGPIRAYVGGTTRICSCIVDSGSSAGIAYAGADDPDPAKNPVEGADLHVEDSTVLGKVRTRTMELASNTIFLAQLAKKDSWKAALWCSRRQFGCIRFCFLPQTIIAPQQFECLPPKSGEEHIFEPKFVSCQFGDPSYMLLSGLTPMAVWTGADNGSQMGVYNPLQETEAVRNVQIRAPEYLPFGLQSGIYLVPSRPQLAGPCLSSGGSNTADPPPGNQGGLPAAGAVIENTARNATS